MPPPPLSPAKKGLLISGAVAFGTSYLLAATVAVAGEISYAPRGGFAIPNPLRPAFIPLVGPLVIVADPRAPKDTAGVVVYVIDSVVQLAGAGLFIAGLLLAPPKDDAPRVAFAPMLRPGGAGLSFALTF